MREMEFGSITDSLPPQAIEAEEAILGGILLDPNAIARVAPLLDAQAFYLNAHKDIYQVMLRLYENGKPTDLLQVIDALKAIDLYSRVGGQNKLVSLLDSTVSAINVDALAEMVMEKQRRRQLIKAGNDVVKLGYDQALDLQDVLVDAEEKVFSVTQQCSNERYQLASAADMATELFDLLESDKLKGEKVGWYDLETLTCGLFPSNLIAVAAETNMGKSHFMISLAHEIMTNLQKPVLYISPEMDKKQLSIRLLAKITGVDSLEIKEGVTEKNWDKVAWGVGQMAELPWKVYDHSSPTIQMIASCIKQATSEFGRDLGAVFVDYLQQIPVEGKGLLSYEIGKIARSLRDMARYHRIPIFVGSQINRENQQRSDKRPTKHDLRNSGEILEVLDQLILLHRPSVYSKDPSDKTIELIVDKNRNGLTGVATMLCDFSTSKFMNMKR